MNTLTKEKVNDIALKNNIVLNSEELDFLYRFVTKNYEALYANPNIDLSKYKSHFTEENFEKIMKLVNDYKIKYANLLN